MTFHFHDSFRGHNPSQSEWLHFISETERLHSEGLSNNQIADTLGLTRANPCVLLRLGKEMRA